MFLKFLFLRLVRFVVSQILKLRNGKTIYACYKGMSWPLSKEPKTCIAAYVFVDCAEEFCKITDLSLQAAADTLDYVL